MSAAGTQNHRRHCAKRRADSEDDEPGRCGHADFGGDPQCLQPERPEVNPRPSTFQQRRTRSGIGGLALLALCSVTLAMTAGCGDRKKDAAGSQTVARVDKEEITVHQINGLLQQQRGLKPEQVDAAGRQILEFLVDQELAVQRTRQLKIDQNPRVMLQIEAARREVLARAYAERVAEGVGKPSAEEVKKYYDQQPTLFKDRRVYSIQELTIEARSEQMAALRQQLLRAKSAAEFVDQLRAGNFRFVGNQGVRAAEQLPAEVLANLARMKDGQMVLLPAPVGAQVMMLVSSRAEPMDEARAAPAIEQFLLNAARRERVEADVKARRVSAKIEYFGKFAEAAVPPAAVAAAAPVAAVAGSASSAAATPGGRLSAEAISKGMGIKQ